MLLVCSTLHPSVLPPLALPPPHSSPFQDRDHCHFGQRTNQAEANLWLTLVDEGWPAGVNECDVSSSATLLSKVVRIGMRWAIDAVTSDGWWETTQLCKLLLALLPVWLLGACIGLLVRTQAVAFRRHAIACTVAEYCKAGWSLSMRFHVLRTATPSKMA